jgi:hypothetical protein
MHDTDASQSNGTHNAEWASGYTVGGDLLRFVVISCEFGSHLAAVVCLARLKQHEELGTKCNGGNNVCHACIILLAVPAVIIHTSMLYRDLRYF